MKVQVHIPDQLLLKYLPTLCRESEGNIHIITRENDFGKFVVGQVKTTYKKVPLDESPHMVTFRLPKCDALDAAESKFLFVSAEDQVKIRDRIKVEFHTDFDRYYLAAKRQDRWTDKQIIEAFIIARGLTDLMADHERLKKRLYRQSIKDHETLVKKLVRKARYRNLEISAQVDALLHSGYAQ